MNKNRAPWRFHHCTHGEIKAYFETNGLVIIPTGSCEQHGLHLPLFTDTLIAEAMAERVGEKEGVLVLPALPYGNSSNHECFPGTVTVDPRTYVRFVQDMVGSLLRHGATKILFINGHSGNAASLQEACDFARENGGFACVANWYSIIGELEPSMALSGHADFVETSPLLALCPELVQLDKVIPYEPARLTENLEFTQWYGLRFKGATVHTWVKTQDVSPQGNLGTMEGSGAETGERIFAVMDEFLGALVRELKTLDVAKLRDL